LWWGIYWRLRSHRLTLLLFIEVVNCLVSIIITAVFRFNFSLFLSFITPWKRSWCLFGLSRSWISRRYEGKWLHYFLGFGLIGCWHGSSFRFFSSPHASSLSKCRLCRRLFLFSNIKRGLLAREWRSVSIHCRLVSLHRSITGQARHWKRRCIRLSSCTVSILVLRPHIEFTWISHRSLWFVLSQSCLLSHSRGCADYCSFDCRHHVESLAEKRIISLLSGSAAHWTHRSKASHVVWSHAWTATHRSRTLIISCSIRVIHFSRLAPTWLTTTTESFFADVRLNATRLSRIWSTIRWCRLYRRGSISWGLLLHA